MPGRLSAEDLAAAATSYRLVPLNKGLTFLHIILTNIDCTTSYLLIGIINCSGFHEAQLTILRWQTSSFPEDKIRPLGLTTAALALMLTMILKLGPVVAIFTTKFHETSE